MNHVISILALCLAVLNLGKYASGGDGWDLILGLLYLAMAATFARIHSLEDH